MAFALLVGGFTANLGLMAAPPPQTESIPVIPRINAPGPGDIYIRAVQQEAEGSIYKLRGAAELETSDTLIRADYIEYNEITGEANAEGNVTFRSFVSGETLRAERVEYNVREETGKFYEVSGQASGKFDTRPGLLTTGNPFTFEGRWAERIKDRYILHEGFLTNCRLPKPIWSLKGPKFDIIPNDRALVHHARLRIGKVPILYLPLFYKSLQERPRKSGFLTPNVGNSSRRGFMLGLGYYWAINRSYDATYRTQYFSQRGFAHHVDIRGKPTQKSDFGFYLYGVNDRGKDLGGGNILDAGGYLMSATGSAELGKGFESRWDINYLSSFLFRQEFTESFNEAVFSEVHSIGFVTKNWSHYGLNFIYESSQNFQSTAEGDVINIRKLPAVEFLVRDKEITRKVLPVWVSLDSTAGFLRRDQPLFQTRSFVERLDIAPRIATALKWKSFHLTPAFTFRGTHYDSSWKNGDISGDGAFRSAGHFDLELRLPSLARIFDSPRWLGDRAKHVIETRAGFHYVTGVDDYSRYIRFDETELLANTAEVDYSITNRLFVKRGNMVHEFLTWELWQARYFDHDFGGAVTEGQRNVLLSSVGLTGYAFLSGPRSYSPIVSNLRVSPFSGVGVSWRSDYDPLRHRFTNSGLTLDARRGHYFWSVGHNLVKSDPLLTPPANQFRGLFVIGDQNKRGWNAAFSSIYDFREGRMQFATWQITRNTDCCGISFQYRRFSFGTRNENQFRVAFGIANIGSFGTLKQQERIF